MTPNQKPSSAEIAYPQKAIEALMNYQQADEDGVMVLVSRQAIHEVFDYVQALRSAAPPRGEPVAWRHGHHNHAWCITTHESMAEAWRFEGKTVEPLYAAPSDRDREDAERLDFVLDRLAFVEKSATDAGPTAYRLMTQNEDEDFVALSGEDSYFKSPRAAIDAAIASAKGGAK